MIMLRMCSHHQWSADRMVQSGNRSETGLFVITYLVQFVPGVHHGKPEELMQVRSSSQIQTSALTSDMQMRQQLCLC